MKPEHLHEDNRELIEEISPKFEEVSEKDKFYQLFDKMRNIRTGLEPGVESQQFEKDIDHLIQTTKKLYHEIHNLRDITEVRKDEELFQFIRSLDTLIERFYENLLYLRQFQKEVKEGTIPKDDILWRLAAIEECKRNITSLSGLFENLPAKKQMSPARMKKWLRPPVVASLTGFVTALGLVFALNKELRETTTTEKATPTQGENFSSSEIPESFEEGKEQGEGNIDGDGEPGLFNRGKFVGEIEQLKGFTSPSLWVSSVATRFPDGKFRTVKRDTQMPSEHWKNKAKLKVDYFQKKVQEGETMTLLVPVGYKTNWEIDVNPGEHVFTHIGNRITFSKAAEVTVQYFLHESEESFNLPDLQPLAGNYSTEYNEALQNLQSGEDPQTVLQNYFGNFTYIVSLELGKILENIPGTLSEKISAMKIGDCDTMSNHASGLFTDARKESVVATGILREGNKLDAAQRHARFVYKDTEGKWQEYELTSLANEAYVNVTFSPKDKSLLQEKAREMAGIQDPQTLQVKYKEFGQLLRNILSQEEYKKYEAQSGQMDSQAEATPQEKVFFSSIEEFIESIKHFFRYPNLPEAIAILIGGIITAFYLLQKSFLTLERSSYKRGGKVIEQQLDDIIQILSESLGIRIGVAEKSPKNLRVDKEIFSRLQWFHYAVDETKESPIYKNAQSKINLEQIHKMSEEQQKMFLLLLDSTRSIIEKPYRMIRLIALFQEKLRWKEFLQNMRETGVNLEGLLVTLKKEFNDPEQERKLLLQVETYVKDIMKKGAEKVPSLHRSAQAPVPTLVQIFSELGVDRLDDLKVQNKPGEGHELYEMRSYRSGDDPKRINWKATARTEKIITNVTAQEKEVGKKSVNKFNIVIDVVSVAEHELQSLVGLLHVAQREPQTLQIGDICFTAHGRAIDQWKSEMIRHLVQKGKPENIQVLVKRVLEMQIKESIGNPKAMNNGTYYEKEEDLNMATQFVPLRLPLKGKNIVFGQVRLEGETKNDTHFRIQGQNIEEDSLVGV